MVILDEAPKIHRPAIHSADFANGHLTDGETTNGEFTNGHRVTNGVEKANGELRSVGLNGDISNHSKEIDREKRVYVFSARSESSLTAYLSSFRDYLERESDSKAFMRDLSFTLGQRRTHHAHRVAVIADSLEALRTELTTAKSRKARDQSAAFVFTGQGAQ